eukprot:1160367-Pelagomonas_calceolata.AAC.3
MATLSSILRYPTDLVTIQFPRCMQSGHTLLSHLKRKCCPGCKELNVCNKTNQQGQPVPYKYAVHFSSSAGKM